jgi:hypothetical protein
MKLQYAAVVILLASLAGAQSNEVQRPSKGHANPPILGPHWARGMKPAQPAVKPAMDKTFGQILAIYCPPPAWFRLHHCAARRRLHAGCCGPSR